jgi:hypothetical protein
MGLSHDDTTTVTYYEGHGNWAPVSVLLTMMTMMTLNNAMSDDDEQCKQVQCSIVHHGAVT